MSQDKASEKAFFDRFAAEKEYDVFHPRGYERLMREFSTRVNPSTDEIFLEIGCGTGAMTRYIARTGLTGVGLDLSYNCVRMATEGVPGATFIVGDAEFLPFPDASFDIIMFSGILHHLPSLGACLEESFRVLKPGGRLFAYDPNGRNPAMWLYRSPDSPFSSRDGITVNERLPLKEEIEDELVNAGFTAVSCTGVSGISYKYVSGARAQKFLELYNFADRCLAKSGLAHRFGAFLISYAQKPSGEGVSRESAESMASDWAYG